MLVRCILRRAWYRLFGSLPHPLEVFGLHSVAQASLAGSGLERIDFSNLIKRDRKNLQ